MIKFLFLLFFLPIGLALGGSYERYFKDTYQSLEAVRNGQSGLVPDSYNIDLKVLTDPTSPTNMGLDLLLQLESKKIPEFQKVSTANIQKMLKTISELDYHLASGLFFNRYSSDGKLIKDFYVSAIDNLHLAFALWTVSMSGNPAEKSLALKLFQRMNFSFLQDSGTGLFFGGAYYQDGKWELEKWKYDYLGSEGRSLYGLGWALGLFKGEENLKNAISHLKVEMNGPILRLWDGGAFQLLLPRLLINEEVYSEELEKSFLTYGRIVLKSREFSDLPVPASFSACQIGLNDYNGKAGSPGLVALGNSDINDPKLFEQWDQVFTPHAAFLMAPLMPTEFEKVMLKAENVGTNYSLYSTGMGWLDGLHVKGPGKGQVVPVYLSLDQAMIALSTAQIMSQDGMLIGSSILFKDKNLRNRLRYYHHLLKTRFLKAQTALPQNHI